MDEPVFKQVSKGLFEDIYLRLGGDVGGLRARDDHRQEATLQVYRNAWT